MELGADASTGSNVLIKGDNIQLDGNVTITNGFVLNAGVIQSTNYVADTSGMKITLSNGTLDSKYFKITSTGVKITGELVAYDTIKMVGAGYADEFDFIKFDLGQGPDDWSITCTALDGNTIWSYNAQSGAYFNIAKYTRSSVGDLGWGTGNQDLIAKSALAFWNGAYSGTGSNLAYCNKGAFGDMATKSTANALTLSYKSSTFVNSLTSGAIIIPDAAGSFGSWMCGPTKNGRIAIATYQASNDVIYIGYGERGRTTNSYTRQLAWNGANGDLSFTGYSYTSAGKGYIIGSHSGIVDLGSAATVLTGNSGSFVRRYDNQNTANVIHASQFAVDSSKLIKENVKNITEEYAKNILKLRPVSFDYIEAIGGQKGQCGMIAEEVLPIFPECVNVPDGYTEEKAIEEIENGNNMMCLSIDYAKFTPYLIKLVQMQQKEIEDLKSMVQNLIAK